MSRQGMEFPRLAWLALGTAALLLTVAGRVAWLSTVAPPVGPQAGDPAEIPAQRGAIWDRDGALLATETYDRYSLQLDREHVEDIDELARLVSPFLDTSAAQLGADIRAGGRWQVLSAYVEPEAADALRALELDGMAVQANASRAYPLGEAAGHLMGFVDVDGEGHYGVEAVYDSELKGSPGRASGRFQTNPRQLVMPTDGHDLLLTVDRDLQLLAWRVLRATVHEQDARAGTILAMDPRSGDLLASASWPSYDPNRYNAYDFDRFNDPAIRSPYPPGSVLKPVSLAAAIDAGLLAPDSTYEDTASVRFGGIQVPNPDRFGHGTTTMGEMLRLSLNVGAVHVAQTLGEERFYAALASFGFGQPLGVDLYGEHGGLVHAPGSESYAPSTFAFNAYGQGLDATLLQVAASISALANDGRRMTPRTVGAVIPARGQPRPLPSRESARVVSPSTALAMRRMMVSVVADRVTEAAVPGYTIGGKTGTSEVETPGRAEKELIASFCGFVPAESPELVVCVRIDNPRDGRGNRVAAPAFRDVVAEAVELLDIQPQDPEAYTAARAAGGGR